MNPLAWLLRRGLEHQAEVRAEIWRLGTRHLGWPLEGALDELKDPGLSLKRTVLLQACVRELQRR
jgi:hypothetical protein